MVGAWNACASRGACQLRLVSVYQSRRRTCIGNLTAAVVDLPKSSVFMGASNCHRLELIYMHTICNTTTAVPVVQCSLVSTVYIVLE